MAQNEPLFEAACFLSEAEAIVGGRGFPTERLSVSSWSLWSANGNSAKCSWNLC